MPALGSGVPFYRSTTTKHIAPTVSDIHLLLEHRQRKATFKIFLIATYA